MGSKTVLPEPRLIRPKFFILGYEFEVDSSVIYSVKLVAEKQNSFESEYKDVDDDL